MPKGGVAWLEIRVQIQNRTKPILFSSMKISESILFCFVVLVLGLCFRRKGKGGLYRNHMRGKRK
jgi:hypothetical protein